MKFFYIFLIIFNRFIFLQLTAFLGRIRHKKQAFQGVAAFIPLSFLVSLLFLNKNMI
jgi:hypothetical protein